MRRSPLRSPPRVRGKAVAIFRQLHHGRITPAYAGKSRSQPRTAPRHRDHPRVCGEKMSRPPAKTRTPGLPPRMRGKEVKALLHFNWVGITPACAGKSSASSSSVHRSRDHPRVCGEKRKTGAVPAPLPGSPPRMRGKGQVSVFLRVFVGITPACAGKSCSSSVSSSQRMS